MKKIFATLIFSLFLAGGFAQPWSSHLVTSDLPVIVNSNNQFDAGNLRIMPDAVTTNGTNTGGRLPHERCVISAFSPTTEGGSIGSWSSSSDVGTWLIAKNSFGGTEFSRRIQVEGYYLRIWSLQYDYAIDRELLIFTGSVHTEGGDGEVRMVIGSYDLQTDLVEITVIEQFYNGSYVASQGIGVREIESSNSDRFFAIGQSSDQNNDDITPNITTGGSGVTFATSINFAAYPIGVIFEVSNSGAINVEYTEIKDFAFKPHTVTDAVTSIDGVNSSLIVGGMRILDDFETVCNNPGPNRTCSTHVAPAAYTFDAVESGGIWSIEVDNGMYLLMDEFGYSGLSVIGIDWPEFHVFVEDDYPNSREVFLGMTDITEQVSQPIEDLMIFKMDVDMSSGGYSLTQEVCYDLNTSGPDAVLGSFERFLPNPGSAEFGVVFSLDDYYNAWSQDNRHSIGYLHLPKSNITSSSLGFISVYADAGVTSTSLSDVNYVTGIQVAGSGDESDILYLLADGHLRETEFTRAHFDASFVNGEDLSFNCYDLGLATPRDPESDPMVDGSQPKKSNPEINDLTSYSDDINYQEWDCEFYPFDKFGKSEGQKETIELSSPQVVRIAKNQFQIQQVEDVVRDYQLYDIAGKQVNVKLSSNRLNLNGMSTGVYLLRYKTAGVYHTEKLVVE